MTTHGGTIRNIDSRNCGPRNVPAPYTSTAGEANGVQVKQIKQSRVACRIGYVTPSHQYPAGATLSLTRRLELLEWAEMAEGWIIEDDYESEFRYSLSPIASIQGLSPLSRVIYVGSFAK